MGKVFFRVVICEDNLPYMKMIENYMNNVFKNSDYMGEIVLKSDNPYDVEDYISKNKAEIFLLDIQLKKDMNGYCLAEKIRRKFSFCYIIFLSNYVDYAIKAFKVRAFDFLAKPVIFDDFMKCLNEVYADYRSRELIGFDEANLLVFKSGVDNYYINKNEIVCFEKIGNKLIIHAINKDIVCYMTFEELEKRLDENFIRCHKSYIANKSYFSEIKFSKKEIIFVTGHKCFIGRKYKASFKDIVS